MAKYQPISSLEVPRFVGIVTFMRLPHVITTEDVDLAVVGVPFDTGATYRVGQRFAPAAIRDASLALRPYNYAQKVDVFDYLSAVDYGDAPITPGYTEESYQAIEDILTPLYAARVVPIVLGGDHSVSLPELRAAAKAYGPVTLIHFDAHADIWNETLGQKYMHGTPFRRALEEGLIEPHTSMQFGMRGPVYDPEDIDFGRDLGIQVIPIDDLRRMAPQQLGDTVRARVGDRPALLTFDIDVVDPAFAPGTGTPEVAGLSSWEALDFVRHLKGVNIVGFDLVEVLPAYDPSGITSILAANVAFEFLSLVACSKRAKTEETANPATEDVHGTRVAGYRSGSY